MIRWFDCATPDLCQVQLAHTARPTRTVTVHAVRYMADVAFSSSTFPRNQYFCKIYRIKEETYAITRDSLTSLIQHLFRRNLFIWTRGEIIICRDILK